MTLASKITLGIIYLSLSVLSIITTIYTTFTTTCEKDKMEIMSLVWNIGSVACWIVCTFIYAFLPKRLSERSDRTKSLICTVLAMALLTWGIIGLSYTTLPCPTTFTRTSLATQSALLCTVGIGQFLSFLLIWCAKHFNTQPIAHIVLRFLRCECGTVYKRKLLVAGVINLGWIFSLVVVVMLYNNKSSCPDQLETVEAISWGNFAIWSTLSLSSIVLIRCKHRREQSHEKRFWILGVLLVLVVETLGWALYEEMNHHDYASDSSRPECRHEFIKIQTLVVVGRVLLYVIGASLALISCCCKAESLFADLPSFNSDTNIITTLPKLRTAAI